MVYIMKGFLSMRVSGVSNVVKPLEMRLVVWYNDGRR